MCRNLIVASLALLFVGCDSDDPGPKAPPTALVGVAATGAPIAGGQVEAICQNGETAATVTAADGSYELAIGDDAPPCALRVTSTGGVFYSFTATSKGVANLTPLTDLVMAHVFEALNVDGSAWFGAPSAWSGLAAAIATAQEALKTALIEAGFAWAASFDPFTNAFAAQAGDAYDDLLEAIAASIAANGGVADYAAFRALFTANQPLPAAPVSGNGLPAPTGDGAALGGLDGATATIGGVTYAYTRFENGGNVEWGAGNPARTIFNFTAFSTTADGTTEALKVWRISGFPPAHGTYQCVEGSLPAIALANGTTLFHAAACTVEIISSAGQNVTGRFSAKFGDEIVTDGYFRSAPATGGGEALAVGELGASFDLDGQTYRYKGISNQPYDTFESLVITPLERESPGFPLGIQLNTIPAAPGTYECDQTYNGNEWRKVNMSFYWNGVAYSAGQRANPSPGPAGASCTITLTSAGDPVEGSFSGTFVSADGASLTVTNGLFRNIAQ